MLEKKKPIVLVVLDGWGYREESKDNAIARAATPCFDALWNSHPHALLGASGGHVGLPEGQMGNSEVGHTTIGAGMVLDTDLVRIGKAAEAGEFSSIDAMRQLFEHVRERGSTLHCMGLVSSGGVHSHSSHLYAFVRAAHEAGIGRIAIHVFTDGRDVAPRSADGYLRELEEELARIGAGSIATVSGRFYAMDRDNNWDRVQRAQDAIIAGIGPVQDAPASQAVAALYEAGITDEHIEPMVFLDSDGRQMDVREGDGVFFFNFRPDRARMIASRMAQYAQDKDIMFVTMTSYDAAIGARTAFSPVAIETTLARELSAHGLTQAHIAETEKYAHATYFLNGGTKEPHAGEEHVLIESRKDIKTHDEAPEMRACEIADEAIGRIRQGTDFIFINFANPDMVGHTGNAEAIVRAIEETDRQLQRVADAVAAAQGILIVTADHGNAEVNIDPMTGEKHVAHTTNPVPLICTQDAPLRNGGLADIAPTILGMFMLPVPPSMSGKSLLKEGERYISA
jgi:2,3-bisphosphoglycerate-independent phosphoglycerate mutase